MHSRLRIVVALVLLAVAYPPASGAGDAAPDAEVPEPLAPCATCHGVSGASLDAGVPHLDEQDIEYLVIAMELLASGERVSRVPAHIPKDWERAQLLKAAQYFGAARGKRARESVDREKAARGRQLFIEKCEACHADGGRESDAKIGGTPRLAGQRIAYLAAQIEAYRKGQRKPLISLKLNAFSGAPMEVQDVQVRERLERVGEADADAIAHYLASNWLVETADKRRSRRR